MATFVEFVVGEMVHIRPKRLPPGAKKKLRPRNAGSFKTLEKLVLMPLF